MDRHRAIEKIELVIRFFVLILLVGTPIAYGSVELWAVTLSMFIISLTAALWFAKMAARGRLSFRKSPFDAPILVFFIIAASSYFWSPYKYASLLSLYGLFSYAAIYYIVLNNFKSGKHLKLLVSLIISIGGFIALIGLLNNYFNIPIIKFAYIKSLKSFSTFVSSSHFSGYVGMCLPFALALLLNDIPKIEKFYLAIIAFLILFAELVSNDKGGWIQFLSIFIFIILIEAMLGRFKGRAWELILGLTLLFWIFSILDLRHVFQRFAAIGTINFAKSPEASVWERWFYWSDTINIIKAHPLLGTGIGSFEYVYPHFRSPQIHNLLRFAHQDYLQLWSELGLAGLLSFAWFVIVFFKRCFETVTRHPETYWNGVAVGATAAIFGILIHSLYDFNLHIPSNMILFVTITAILISRSNLPKQRDLAERLALSRRYPPIDKDPLPLPVRVFIITVVLLAFTGVSFVLGRMYLADLHYKNAVASEDGLDWNTAMNEYDLAIRFEPRNATYHYRFGELCFARSRFRLNPKSGEYKEMAIKSYSKAVELNPLDGNSYLGLATLYSFNKEASLAQSYFSRAIDCDPNNAFFHSMLGLFYLNSGDMTKAGDEFRAALSINPDEPIANANLVKTR